VVGLHPVYGFDVSFVGVRILPATNGNVRQQYQGSIELEEGKIIVAGNWECQAGQKQKKFFVVRDSLPVSITAEEVQALFGGSDAPPEGDDIPF
jgi:hypothetical protein